MITDREVSDKLWQYKISQIACLVWVNLFPYCFFFAWYLIAPGYVILSRFLILHPMDVYFWLFTILQAAVMLFLIWGQISRQSLFTPKNLLHWFFASIFVIFISLVGLVPPSFIVYENPCMYPDELQRIGVLGTQCGPFIESSSISPQSEKTFIARLTKAAQKDPTVCLAWCVRILSLMLLLANVLLCGFWFTRRAANPV